MINIQSSNKSFVPWNLSIVIYLVFVSWLLFLEPTLTPLENCVN